VRPLIYYVFITFLCNLYSIYLRRLRSDWDLSRHNADQVSWTWAMYTYILRVITFSCMFFIWFICDASDRIGTLVDTPQTVLATRKTANDLSLLVIVLFVIYLWPLCVFMIVYVWVYVYIRAHIHRQCTTNHRPGWPHVRTLIYMKNWICMHMNEVLFVFACVCVCVHICMKLHIGSLVHTLQTMFDTWMCTYVYIEIYIDIYIGMCIHDTCI